MFLDPLLVTDLKTNSEKVCGDGHDKIFRLMDSFFLLRRARCMEEGDDVGVRAFGDR